MKLSESTGKAGTTTPMRWRVTGVSGRCGTGASYDPASGRRSTLLRAMTADEATPGASSGNRGRRKLYRDIATTLGTRALLLPLGLASSVLVTRALGPADKGIYTTALTFATLATAVGSVGFGRAATYFIAREERSPRDVRAATLALSVLNGIVLTGAMVLLALTVLPTLFEGVGTDVFLIAAPIGLLTLLRLAYEGFLRGEQRTQAVNALALIFSAAFVLPVAAWILAGELTPEAAVALKAASFAVTVVAAGFMLGRGKLGIARRWDRATVPAVLGFGIPFAIATLTQTLSYRIDILLVQVIAGNEDVGWYSITTTFAELLWYLPMAVGLVVFPRVAAGRAQRSDATEVAALCRWTVLATGLGALGVALLASPLIELMFGSDFLPAASATRLIMPGIVINVFFQVLSGYLAGAGRLRAVLVGTTVGLTVNVVLNLILIPEMGIDGAAVASSISYAIGAAIVAVAFLRATGVAASSIVLPAPREMRERAASLLGMIRRR